MKRIMALLLAALLAASAASCGSVRKTDVSAALAWIEEKIEDNELFSFDYNGQEYASFIGYWDKKVERGENAFTVSYTSPENVTAWAEIALDPVFNALEWCCYFENKGESDSPAISNIRAMRSGIAMESPVLTSANGSAATASDFAPFSVDLMETGMYSMKTSGGRSSQGAFPLRVHFRGHAGNKHFSARRGRYAYARYAASFL